MCGHLARTIKVAVIARWLLKRGGYSLASRFKIYIRATYREVSSQVKALDIIRDQCN